MRTVENLWGGALPEFDGLNAANELIGALAMGLWNRLTRHQNRKSPFHLTRMELPRDGKTLARYARIRTEELDGFIEGLFGDEEALALPKRAHQAVEALVDIRSFFNGYAEFAEDAEVERDFEGTVRNVAELSRIAEIEINAAVLSCTRARWQMPDTNISERPIQH